MTLREMLLAVVEGRVDADVVERAEAEIAKMDAANAKRREKNAEKSKKNFEVVKEIAGFLGDEAKTASMVMKELVEAGFERADGKDLNTQFVSSQLRKVVEAGLAVQTEIKVKGKGVQKAYIAL